MFGGLEGVSTSFYPKQSFKKCHSHEWQWGLAHELAHIKRRAHLVRWVEWASGLPFWWNPLMWLARNKLRAAEEICTDSLVLNTFQTSARSYAQSILNTLEALAPSIFRPPAMASELNSGGNLEKRMKHILNQAPSRKPRILHICVILASTAFLPLGIARAEEEKPAKKTNFEPASKEREKVAFLKIRKAVAAGDLTKEEAAKKMEAIKKRAKGDNGLRAKYAEAEAKMKAAVEAGKMTPNEATERLAQLAKRLKAASANKPANDKMRAVAEQIEEARKAGKITDEEAREKQEALRRRVADSGKANDQRMRREKYADAESKLKKAVEAGGLSEEAAENRLWPDEEK
ncbi:MAG: polyhydroxyalkanoate synthesis regulator phasin [Akkermansiaceae bacterium]